jgi:hypothetical protein
MVLYRTHLGLVDDPAQAVRNSGALPPVECSVCGMVKPVSRFAPTAKVATCKGCWEAGRKERNAHTMRTLRAATPHEEKAAKQAAFRAGMRKDKCAICRGPIEGYGICDVCEGHVSALGGLDGLKQAVRAVRYLQSE